MPIMKKYSLRIANHFYLPHLNLYLHTVIYKTVNTREYNVPAPHPPSEQQLPTNVSKSPPTLWQTQVIFIMKCHRAPKFSE